MNYKVKKSKTGLGLFTDKDFKKGDFIIGYKGRLINNKEADKKGGKYLFRINSKKTIDGSTRKNIARYINHSCKPNSAAYIEGRQINIYARKNIKSGDEITYNYGKEYFDEFIAPLGCKCDSCQK